MSERPSAGERVAKELVDSQRVELWESQQAYEDAKVALAAALAACAREARLDEHRLTCTRYAMKQAGHKIEASLECVRCGALERAAGERAGDLRVKS